MCPRNCNVDRSVGLGFCQAPQKIKIARVALHYFEEPCISGTKGSGTVFFCGCNMRCCFCQNGKISAFDNVGVEIDDATFEKLLFYVDNSDAHNANLVSPSQYGDAIARVLKRIKPQLKKPVVYNTNSYERVELLRKLDGLVDVYLPDVKYYDNTLSKKYSQTENYFSVATEALKEMLRQQPENVYDENGIIKKGVIVRHLVLPDCINDSKMILDALAGISKELTVSLMSQYFVARECSFSSLNRRLTPREYRSVVEYFFNLGMHNGYSQDLTSATEEYVPEFSVEKLETLLDEIKE